MRSIGLPPVSLAVASDANRTIFRIFGDLISIGTDGCVPHSLSVVVVVGCGPFWLCVVMFGSSMAWFGSSGDVDDHWLNPRFHPL